MRNLGSALLVLASFAIGCGGGSADLDVYPASLTDEALLEAQRCSVETRCPDGLECMVLDLVDEPAAICTDPSEVCGSLDCGDGECVILESYPARVSCMDRASR